MMNFEDVHIQLVDLPPIAPEHMDLFVPNIVRGADAAVLVVDPTSPALPEDVEEIWDPMPQSDGVVRVLRPEETTIDAQEQLAA